MLLLAPGRVGLVPKENAFFFSTILRNSFAFSFGPQLVIFLRAESGYATAFTIFVLIYLIFGW